MPKYPALLVAALSLAFAPAPVYRPKKAEPASARVVAAMESFRTKMPPAVGMGEHNGLSVKELEPFIMSHLAGVARRLGVKTKAECIALMPYIADRDFKIRFIAQQAIDGTTKAYPNGMSIECLLDTGSVGHREMARRFQELIDQLDP
jgi:hypothetical protein